MARNEARILVEIWDDEDFLALSHPAQRMYLFLLSQRELQHTGFIPMRVPRWAVRSPNTTEHDVLEWLDELERTRFVVIDLREQELLVRSLIRRDKVYRQPNVMRAAMDTVPMITSAKLRYALAVELGRIADQEPMTDGAAEVVEEMRELLARGLGNYQPDPSENPCDMGSGKGSDMGSGKGSDMGSSKGCSNPPGDWGDTTSSSGSTSPYPNPQAPGAFGADEPDDPDGLFASTAETAAPPAQPHTHPRKTWTPAQIDADPKWQEFWAAYPSIKSKGQARPAWIKALKSGATPEELIEGAKAYRHDRKRKPDYTKHAATWLNAEGWKDYDAPVEEPMPAHERPFWEN